MIDGTAAPPSLDAQLRSRDEETRRAAVASLGGGDEALAVLIDMLGDESWRVRKEATLRAASWSDAHRVAVALVGALAERDNVGRRNAAVEALARLGTVALQPLLDSLATKPEHRKLIVDTLGLVGDPRAVPALIPSLEDPDTNVRSAAAESLGHLGGAEAEAALARNLGKGELLVTLACLEALNALGACLPVSRLAPLAGTPVLRPAALTALGYSGSAEAAALLVPALSDRSRAVREAATVALARLFESIEASGAADARHRIVSTVAALTDEAEHLLVLALLEGTGGTRRAAATVLGLSGRSSATRPLVLALGDYAVEEAAGSALLALGSAAIAPIAAIAGELDPGLRVALLRLVPGIGADPRLEALLRDALRADDPDVAAAAARALGEVGGPDSVQPLFNALASELIPAAAETALTRLATRLPEEVRRHVGTMLLEGPEAARYCRIVGACGRAEDVPLLVGLLQSGTPEVRAAAAEALGPVGAAASQPSFRGDHVEPALARALADSAPDVRAAAARALSACPNPRTIALLAGAFGDREAGVRAAAAWALGAVAAAGHADADRILREREPLESDPLVHAVIDAALHGQSAR